MNEISCGVCMDLIPLVRDGVAGDESRAAVERHVAGCAACRAAYGEDAPPVPDVDRALDRLARRTRMGAAMAMVFGMFFGLSLVTGTDMFYNILIMPATGALAYVVFRWRALYALPGLLAVSHIAVNFLAKLNGSAMDLPSLFWWMGVCCLLALAGTLAAGLLHFAFRREEDA